MRKFLAALLLISGLASAALAQDARTLLSIRTTSGSGAATSAAVSSGTLVWTGTAPTTWTVTLPPNPTNGTLSYIITDTTLTSMVTVLASSGDTLVAAFASQTLTANTTVVGWQFYAPSRTWYRIE